MPPATDPDTPAPSRDTVLHHLVLHLHHGMRLRLGPLWNIVRAAHHIVCLVLSASEACRKIAFLVVPQSSQNHDFDAISCSCVGSRSWLRRSTTNLQRPDCLYDCLNESEEKPRVLVFRVEIVPSKLFEMLAHGNIIKNRSSPTRRTEADQHVLLSTFSVFFEKTLSRSSEDALGKNDVEHLHIMRHVNTTSSIRPTHCRWSNHA